MIELFDENRKDMQRKSSKGNQLKWESEGKWYKADFMGYEGLAEYMVSSLLEKSNLKKDYFAKYNLEHIRYKHTEYEGVKSKNFLRDDWQIITLERLYKNRYNKSFTESLWKIPDVKERLRFLVDEMQQITGIPDFGIYMSRLLTIDAFFLNEDRHMHNVAVLMNGKGQFICCPYFDHGAALLSDIKMDYPVGVDVIQLMDDVKAKTISQSFDEALDAAEELYGYHLRFTFGKKDVDELLAGVDRYPDEIKNRVRTILFLQIRKYEYLFR